MSLPAVTVNGVKSNNTDKRAFISYSSVISDIQS
jgi:hypothetical protein